MLKIVGTINRHWHFKKNSMEGSMGLEKLCTKNVEVWTEYVE